MFGELAVGLASRRKRGLSLFPVLVLSSEFLPRNALQGNGFKKIDYIAAAIISRCAPVILSHEDYRNARKSGLKAENGAI